jgi:hypothetical protein
MKKLSLRALTQLIVVLGLIVVAQSAMAKMTSLSDDELGDVTAQAGIAIAVDNLNLDATIKTLYYHDKDGAGEGSGTTGGYLSLNDIVLIGSVNFDKPMTIDVQTELDASGNQEVTSVNMTLSDMTVDIEQFTIDSITLGSEAGKGASLGSFGIYGLHARITGNISITAH